MAEPAEKDTLDLPPGYTLDRGDADLWVLRREDGSVAEKLLAAFFVLFAYICFHIHRLAVVGWTHQFSLHEGLAKNLKEMGVDFSEIAQLSRRTFNGYGISRFRNPDGEMNRALGKIRSL